MTQIDKRRRTFQGLVIVLGVASLLPGTLGCSEDYSLLLTVRADAPVRSFDLHVRSIPGGERVIEKNGESVDPTNPQRDISRPEQAMKLAIEFSQPGNYLVYILGRGDQQDTHFYLRDFQVDGVREEEIQLVPLVVDEDRDGFPPCGAEGINCAIIACNFLDCADNEFGINPLAEEICGNGLDDDCSGGCSGDMLAGDVPCGDLDGDGVSPPLDCDDTDPCRSGGYVEAGNTCDYAGKGCTGGIPVDQFPALASACLEGPGQGMAPPFCGDGVDQDCNGQDEPCFEDKDCDCVGAAEDCDDNNPEIPSAGEVCYDGVDNNCNNLIDEGCLPCDIDGDGHARRGSGGDDPACLPDDDHDDYDAGIYPGVTDDAESNGAEGGHVLGALREYCSKHPTKNSTPEKPERHRDVDHDGDGLPAKDDGCPSEACDADGDGFENGSCSPPHSRLDCNDDDPTIFPGAPDKAGNNVAENCVSDVTCEVDADGDGYCSDVDCDDTDPEIRPWATEICDDKDNDCDGLVDEGNPDQLGFLIPTLEPNCNDDNDGVCGQPRLSGKCACSSSKPNSTLDSNNNREACSGENLQASASQRCFGAKQPQRERCELGDFNCDGDDSPVGADFVGANQPCSITKGSCTAGVVDGCELNWTVPFIDRVLNLNPGYNPHWSCSGNLPIDELCNGKDDDCDGVIPGDEVDQDKDGYVPCTSCDPATSDPRAMFKLPLVGCSDCDNSTFSMHPGAEERCNGLNDDCDNDPTDDGADDCPGSCCQGMCRDLLNDDGHCGGCNNPCGPGVECVNGECLCTQGVCDGCCDGGTCVARSSLTVDLCGSNGGTCRSCRDTEQCTGDQCDTTTGACINTPLSSESTCDSNQGLCLEGSCCTGCVQGNTCYHNDLAHCGAGGIPCAPCVAVGTCQQASCATGSCVITKLTGSCVLDGETGLCSEGSCCTGCIEGATCYQSDPSHCGTAGGSCTPCVAAGDCEVASCVDGNCSIQIRTGSCEESGQNGQCLLGDCCTGCISKGVCYSGNDHDYCGDYGWKCDKCGPNEACFFGTCESNH